MDQGIISITRRIQFCAGHRLMNHEGGCAHLHGHNYVTFITCEAKDQSLDSVGRIIDFSVIKEKVGGWIEKNWDHGYILNTKDTAALDAIARFNARGGPRDKYQRKQKLFQLDSHNPTAENMALYLLRNVCPRMLSDVGVVATSITLWETENCYATVSLAEKQK